MRVPKPGIEGGDVRKWQLFLVGQRLAQFVPNGKLDHLTGSGRCNTANANQAWLQGWDGTHSFFEQVTP